MDEIRVPPLILGIDPGRTTGLAVVDGETGNVIDTSEVLLYHGIEECLLRWGITVVVAEDFIVRSAAADNRDPLAVLGVIQFLTERHGIPLFVQSPNILRTYKGQFLKFSSHERSAVIHICEYLRRSRKGKVASFAGAASFGGR